MYQDPGDDDAHLLHHQVAERNPDAVWMCSPDWSTLKFSTDAYERIWGRPLDELVADPTSFLDDVHPDDRERVREATAELSGERAVELEFRVLPADDAEQRDVWFEGEPVYGDDGEFVAIANYARDVTERKRNRRRLERANERLGAFNAFLSHDLTNKLQTAMGFLELAREEDDPAYYDRVERALERMDAMTTDLLALPRLDFDELERERVPLETLAEECWRALEVGESALVVEADEPLRVDEGLFRNVLENLLQNAVVHNEDPVTVRVGPLDGAGGFYVEDDGRGVDEDDRSDLFEFGYSTEGHGFGLALVREVVDLHGGSIAVTDGDAGGARFEVECPICEAESADGG